MPVFQAERYARLTGTTTAVSTTGKTTIQVVPGSTVPIPVQILRVKCKRATGAAAATFTPRIYSAFGASAGDITQEYAGTATAVATLFDATNILGWCQTDSSGNLYFQVNPNVGGTDTWSYVVDLLVYR